MSFVFLFRHRFSGTLFQFRWLTEFSVFLLDQTWSQSNRVNQFTDCTAVYNSLVAYEECFFSFFTDSANRTPRTGCPG